LNDFLWIEWKIVILLIAFFWLFMAIHEQKALSKPIAVQNPWCDASPVDGAGKPEICDHQ
jgi:hypothetical protein